MSRSSVLHISGNRYPQLPTDHHTARIWKQLARGVDEYHILARAENMRFSRSSHGNIHLHLLPSFGERMWVFFFLSWLLPFYILRYRPNRLIAQSPVLGGLPAALCSRIFGIPLLVEIHGSYYFDPIRRSISGYLKHFVYRSVTAISFSAASNVRSLSPHMTSQIEINYGGKIAAKTVEIPTRVDLSVFSRPKLSYEIRGPIKLVTVGAFSPRKNHLNLIRDLAACGVPFELTLVGKGALREQYLDLCKQLGIEEHVFITQAASHEELADLLRTKDAYIHYSLSEGLARAILEAMAMGLPVITTDSGFIDGVLKSDANCLVLAEPFGGSLGPAMKKVFSSPEVRKRLGENGRWLVEEKYDAAIVFEKYRSVIIALGSDLR